MPVIKILAPCSTASANVWMPKSRLGIEVIFDGLIGVRPLEDALKNVIAVAKALDRNHFGDVAQLTGSPKVDDVAEAIGDSFAHVDELPAAAGGIPNIARLSSRLKPPRASFEWMEPIPPSWPVLSAWMKSYAYPSTHFANDDSIGAEPEA